jgi:hypothetical protein
VFVAEVRYLSAPLIVPLTAAELTASAQRIISVLA